jgi:MFS superfamily sulfate permease-like transporter
VQTLAIYLYVTAVGFVAAGLLASFVQLVSGQPLNFGLEPDSVIASITGVLLRVLAGPAILMRNAWRGRRLETRAPIWLGLSTLIAGLWSLFSGTLVLAVIFRL